MWLVEDILISNWQRLKGKYLIILIWINIYNQKSEFSWCKRMSFFKQPLKKKKKGLFQTKSVPYLQVTFVLVHKLCLSDNRPVARKKGAWVVLLMPFSSVPWCHHFASHSDGKCWLIILHHSHSLMFSHVLLQKALLIFQHSPQHSLVTIALLSLPISFIRRVCQRTALCQGLCCVLGNIRE